MPSIISEGVRRAPASRGKKDVTPLLETYVLSNAALSARLAFLLGDPK